MMRIGRFSAVPDIPHCLKPTHRAAVIVLAMLVTIDATPAAARVMRPCARPSIRADEPTALSALTLRRGVSKGATRGERVVWGDASGLSALRPLGNKVGNVRGSH